MFPVYLFCVAISVNLIRWYHLQNLLKNIHRESYDAELSKQQYENILYISTLIYTLLTAGCLIEQCGFCEYDDANIVSQGVQAVTHVCFSFLAMLKGLLII